MSKKIDKEKRAELLAIRKLLNRAYLIDYEIKALEDLQKEERDRVMKMTSSADSVRVASTADVHKFDRLVEFEDKIGKMIDRQIALKDEIADLISLVPDRRQRIVLIDRYIRFKPWEYIAVSMDASCRQVFRWRNEGEAYIAEKVKKM